jgi:hypothetical protein
MEVKQRMCANKTRAGEEIDREKGVKYVSAAKINS